MDCCFVCSGDCKNSFNFLINLTSKKFKTKFTSLIGDFISSEYELRITDDNKICDRCSIIIEKYDDLKHEAQTVKSVLSRQIAKTYEIESNETMVYMDKSKIFAEVGAGSNTSKYDYASKYACKLCPHFVTDSIDLINTHCLYHKISTESKIDTARAIKEVTSAPKRNLPIRRESPSTETRRITRVSEGLRPTKPEQPTTTRIKRQSESKQQVPAIDESNVDNQEYDENFLEQQIDLDLLEDPLCDSNLRNNKCMVSDCHLEFKYINEYVRHLKLSHKSTLNQIYAVVRANIKRPTKVSKFMCPFCFTKLPNSQSLELHVVQHEQATKSNLFVGRIGEFVANILSSCRCKTCDWEISDPTVIECSHLVAKNGLVQKISCSFCCHEFYSDKLYNNHLAAEHGTCFICGQISTSDDVMVLVDHIRSHLSHAEFYCQFCNDIYQTKEDRLEHLKLKHSEQCCGFCDDWFGEKKELDDHVRYAHADKRKNEKFSFCDVCGGSFKTKAMFAQHLLSKTHEKRRIFSCSVCKDTFRFRYLLMNHITSAHNRTIVDADFYKCFICMRSYKAQNREDFLKHLSEHQKASNYCCDCNVSLESASLLLAHRERTHQDFSLLVDKKQQDEALKTRQKLPTTKREHLIATAVPANRKEVLKETIEDETEFDVGHDITEQQEQQIMVQTEDGTLLNMNNFILTENGELILQNLLLPNGQESVEDTSEGQVHSIDNLEQFLMEQGLSNSAEISYIQEDENQVIIQNEDGTVSQSSQGSLLQTYKEIFEPDDNIPTELIATSEIPNESVSQNLMLSGDFFVQSMPKSDQNRNGKIVEQIEVQNVQTIDANQSTLDELGDILLEVAAAAEKEKKPKADQTKFMRESLWGTKKHSVAPNKLGTSRKRSEPPLERLEQPASNFSQAYEFFVKGFDAKKQKQM